MLIINSSRGIVERGKKDALGTLSSLKNQSEEPLFFPFSLKCEIISNEVLYSQ